MNNRNTLILVVLAVVLGAVAYLGSGDKGKAGKVSGSANSGTNNGKSASGAELITKLFEGVGPDSVKKIEIQPPSAKESIVLEKNGDAWEVLVEGKGRRLVKYRAEGLFQSYNYQENKQTVDLQGPVKAEFVAHNPENHKEFDLTAEKAIRVKFYDKGGKVLEDVLIGKAAQGTSSYVRKPEKNEVYRVALNLTNRFSGDKVELWRDRRIFGELDVDKVHHLLVDDRINTRTYELVRTSPAKGEKAGGATGPATWKMVGESKSIRTGSAAARVRDIANASAAEFVGATEAASVDFSKPSFIATLSTADEATSVVLTLGPEKHAGANQWYAKSNKSDDVYLVGKLYSAMNAPSELIETPTPTPPPTPLPTVVPNSAATSADAHTTATATTEVNPASASPTPAPEAAGAAGSGAAAAPAAPEATPAKSGS